MGFTGLIYRSAVRLVGSFTVESIKFAALFNPVIVFDFLRYTLVIDEHFNERKDTSCWKNILV